MSIPTTSTPQSPRVFVGSDPNSLPRPPLHLRRVGAKGSPQLNSDNDDENPLESATILTAKKAVVVSPSMSPTRTEHRRNNSDASSSTMGTSSDVRRTSRGMPPPTPPPLAALPPTPPSRSSPAIAGGGGSCTGKEAPDAAIAALTSLSGAPVLGLGVQGVRTSSAFSPTSPSSSPAAAVDRSIYHTPRSYTPLPTFSEHDEADAESGGSSEHSAPGSSSSSTSSSSSFDGNSEGTSPPPTEQWSRSSSMQTKEGGGAGGGDGDGDDEEGSRALSGRVSSLSSPSASVSSTTITSATPAAAPAEDNGVAHPRARPSSTALSSSNSSNSSSNRTTTSQRRRHRSSSSSKSSARERAIETLLISGRLGDASQTLYGQTGSPLRTAADLSRVGSTGSAHRPLSSMEHRSGSPKAYGPTAAALAEAIRTLAYLPDDDDDDERGEKDAVTIDADNAEHKQRTTTPTTTATARSEEVQALRYGLRFALEAADRTARLLARSQKDRENLERNYRTLQSNLLLTEAQLSLLQEEASLFHPLVSSPTAAATAGGAAVAVKRASSLVETGQRSMTASQRSMTTRKPVPSLTAQPRVRVQDHPIKTKRDDGTALPTDAPSPISAPPPSKTPIVTVSQAERNATPTPRISSLDASSIISSSSRKVSTSGTAATGGGGGGVSIASLRKAAAGATTAPVVVEQRYTPRHLAASTGEEGETVSSHLSTATAAPKEEDYDSDDSDNERLGLVPPYPSSSRRATGANKPISLADFLDASRMSRDELAQMQHRALLESILAESPPPTTPSTRRGGTGGGGSGGGGRGRERNENELRRLTTGFFRSLGGAKRSKGSGVTMSSNSNNNNKSRGVVSQPSTPSSTVTAMAMAMAAGPTVLAGEKGRRKVMGFPSEFEIRPNTSSSSSPGGGVGGGGSAPTTPAMRYVGIEGGEMVSAVNSRRRRLKSGPSSVVVGEAEGKGEMPPPLPSAMGREAHSVALTTGEEKDGGRTKTIHRPTTTTLGEGGKEGEDGTKQPHLSFLETNERKQEPQHLSPFPSPSSHPPAPPPPQFATFQQAQAYASSLSASLAMTKKAEEEERERVRRISRARVLPCYLHPQPYRRGKEGEGVGVGEGRKGEEEGLWFDHLQVA